MKRVDEMYAEGASNAQVAEFLFGPQWAMVSTPKEGWEMQGDRWRPAGTAPKWLWDNSLTVVDNIRALTHKIVRSQNGRTQHVHENGAVEPRQVLRMDTRQHNVGGGQHDPNHRPVHNRRRVFLPGAGTLCWCVRPAGARPCGSTCPVTAMEATATRRICLCNGRLSHTGRWNLLVW